MILDMRWGGAWPESFLAVTSALNKGTDNVSTICECMSLQKRSIVTVAIGRVSSLLMFQANAKLDSSDQRC